MRFEIGRVDHHGLFLAVLGGQPDHHCGENAFLAPTLSPAVERLVRPILPGGVWPAQAIAIDEDNRAQNTLVIDAWFAVRLGEDRGQLGHLLVGQSVKVAHVTAPFSKP